MVKQKPVKNLLEMSNKSLTRELLEKINQGEKVLVSIYSNGKGKQLVWNNECMFIFDACRCGDERYNAVSVIRDLLKENHSDGHWTRNKVGPLIDFENKKDAQPFTGAKKEKVETQ